MFAESLHLPIQIQQALPLMMRLSLEQRASIASLLLSAKKENSAVIHEKIPRSRLGTNMLGATYVSDDFDEDLGDDFWLGKDQ